MGNRWLLGAVALTACGRLDFDESNLGPFSPPQLIEELSTSSSEDDPALTGDELEIYFDTNRPGGKGGDDIWRATRSDRHSPWNAPTPVDELGSASSDVAPGISLDGLTIVFSRNGGGNDYDLFVATRPDRASPWNTPSRIDELSSASEDTNAQLSTNELVLWFASTRASTARNLWVATRPSRTAMWEPAVPVDALNSSPTAYTGDPDPNANDTRLYFVTDEGGNKDLWVVDRPTPTTFGTPHPIDELASPAPESDPWISIDEHRLYYAKRMNGSVDLVIAERP